MSKFLYPVTPEDVVGVSDSSKVLYVPRADYESFGIVRLSEDFLFDSNGNLKVDFSDIISDIGKLAEYKVGRYDVNNIPDDIDYIQDGEKSPNNIYYNFESLVKDNPDIQKGMILVSISDNVQTELFISNTGRVYTRTISGGTVSEFTTLVANELEDYYDNTESDERFVHLQGDESIAGVKTFTDKILVEDPTSNKMAVNRQSMQGYAYSKEEINNLTIPIGFETEQNFLDWLGGTFTRPDGILPSDLLIGKKIIIQEEGKNNYQVAVTPVVDLSDFKVLVEDNKFAEEIGFKPYETINADNVQDAVEEVKDEVDLKTQIVRLDDLVINTEDWIIGSEEVYFDKLLPEFTNTLEQQIEIQNNSNEQSTLFINEGITVKAVETIGLMPDLGIRLILNKAPSETITLSVWLSNSTNILFEPAEITAGKINYNNTVSGLIADNVQGAVDELSQKSNNISDSLIDLEDRVDDLESEMIDKADISYVDAGLAGKASTSALNLKADKTDVDTLKLYNHKIILNRTSGNNSHDAFVNLILNTNVEITTLSDLNTKIVSIYGTQPIPATGVFHTTVDDKYWYNINSISSIGNGLQLGGMGYQNSSSSDLKPYITQPIGLDGADGWTLVSDTVVELN